jgi:hypothetical protein
MVKFLLILITALLTSVLTRWLIKEKKVAPIRASSFITLMILGALSLFQFEYKDLLGAAALGGTFVGMTESARLPKRSFLFAGLLFSLLFYFLLPLNQGLGGALGMAAFLSSVSSFHLRNAIKLVILNISSSILL